MQVLVALARAGGQPVSREALINVCWGDVTVGEDALNRCIQRLRRLADADAKGAFTIYTIPRVGYRLTAIGNPAVAPPSADQPRLAVLAFDNLSGDPDMVWFSDGVSEEILQTVARGAALKVIGRGSSFQFRGVGKDAKHVAAELNVTHILDGSVRRSGARLRIATHLIECAQQTTIWSDRFERDLVDIFALQDEIAAGVATAVSVVFASNGQAAAISPAAYDLYLKARRKTGDVIDEATFVSIIRLLEQATALAPGFARAWAALASIRVSQLRFGDPDEPYAILRGSAVEAAETALRLDPLLGAVHQALSRLEAFGRYADRESLNEKALYLAPNDADVLSRASFFYYELGRVREALSYAKRAFELDPLQFGAAYAYASFLDSKGDYDAGRDLWDKSRIRWPDNEMILYAAVAGAAYHADWARFTRLIESAPAALTENKAFRAIRWFARNLRDPDAGALAHALEVRREQLNCDGRLPLDWLTSLYSLGMADETFELIDKASFAYMFDREERWASGPTNGGIIFSVTGNNGMMHDPRFPRLCAKLGLCAYWVKSERWPDCADDGVLPYDFKAECRRLATA